MLRPLFSRARLPGSGMPTSVDVPVVPSNGNGDGDGPAAGAGLALGGVGAAVVVGNLVTRAVGESWLKTIVTAGAGLHRVLTWRSRAATPVNGPTTATRNTAAIGGRRRGVSGTRFVRSSDTVVPIRKKARDEIRYCSLLPQATNCFP